MLKFNVKQKKGFTLIELMIVIVILGLLMAYAIPNYRRYVIISKRTEAKDTLTQIAAAQERHKMVFGAYASGDLRNTPENVANLAYPQPDTNNYTYAMATTANASGTIIAFTVTATAINYQTEDTYDGGCTSLTLNSVGVKTPLDCWQ